MSNKYSMVNKTENSKFNKEKSNYFKDLSNEYTINNTISPINESNKMNYPKNNNSNLSDLSIVNQLNFKSISNKYIIMNKPPINPNVDSNVQKKNVEIEKNLDKIKNQNETENFGLYTKNNMIKSTIGNLINDKTNEKMSNKKNELDKLIISNLENELDNKNIEINILKRNFKDKIDLVEQENKNSIEKLEGQFNLIMENLNKNHSDNVSGLELSTLQMKNEYDDMLSKLQMNIINMKNNSVNVEKHENIISEIKAKSFVKIEDCKNIYENKMKELVNYFDKPEYRKMIENINFYMKFKEQINFAPEDIEFLESDNFTDKECELWMDRIKLNLVTAECDYINGVIQLENNYLELYEKIKSNEMDKFSVLENEIVEKFDNFSKLSLFHEDLNNIVEEGDDKNNSKSIIKQKNDSSIYNDKILNKIINERSNVKFQDEENYMNYNANKLFNKDEFEIIKENDKNYPDTNKQIEKVIHRNDNFYANDIEYKKGFETDGKKMAVNIPNNHINNLKHQSMNKNNLDTYKLNSVNLSNKNSLYDSKFKTFKGESERESEMYEFKGRSLYDKMDNYLGSNYPIKENQSNKENYDEKMEIYSNNNMKSVKIIDSNRHSELYLTDDFDLMDVGDEDIVTNKINSLGEAHILTHHK